MKQQQSFVQDHPDVNYSAYQQPSSSFQGLNQQASSTSRGLNQQSTFHRVYRPMGNNITNQLQYRNDPTANVHQQLMHSLHQVCSHQSFNRTSSLNPNKCLNCGCEKHEIDADVACNNLNNFQVSLFL